MTEEIKLLKEILAYEKKWDYKEFKEYYIDDIDFLEYQRFIIENAPYNIYTYIYDKFKEIINNENLYNSYNINRLHEATDLLIKIGIYLQKNNIKIN